MGLSCDGRTGEPHGGMHNASSPLSATCRKTEKDRRHVLAAARTRRSTLKSQVRPDEDVGDQTHSREAGGARAGEAGVAQRITVTLLEEEFGGEARFRGRWRLPDCARGRYLTLARRRRRRASNRANGAASAAPARQPARARSRQRREGGRCGSRSRGLLLYARLAPRADAANAFPPSDEMTVVVRQTQRLHMTEARAESSDTAARDAAIDVVHPGHARAHADKHR